MTTSKRSLPERLAAMLLALVMVMALAPTAWASPNYVLCPHCGLRYREVAEIREGTCQEEAIYQYTCWNSSCEYYNQPELEMGRLNPDNHADAHYVDDGNGYHSGVCEHHNPSVAVPAERHTFNDNGVCTKCYAVDYNSVTMNLPEELLLPAALNSTDAKLSVGELKLTLGGTNVTDDYNLSYSWYNREGSLVASTPEYILPTTVTEKEGTYYYVLHVNAYPKSASRKPVVGTCMVTVTVEDLITASAIIAEDEGSLFLGDPDSWSGESVSAQIYAAVQDACRRSADPDYVVFHDLPANSTVGSLSVSVTSTRYYFEARSGRKPLDDVKFTVATGNSATTGDYTAGFTAYDTEGNNYPGVLTITVQQHADNMDVVVTTAKDGFVTLDPEVFEDFWNRTYANGELDSVSFLDLPKSTEGSLYVDYVSASAPGLRVTAKDNFYIDPVRNQYGIDSVTFVPGVKQVEYITLDFEAQGTKNNGRVGYLEGTLYIFIHSGGSADVTVTASAETALSAAAFQKAYQSATGGTGSNFYIQLLEVPARGSLYVGRTASRPGTLLNARSVSNYSFSYSDSKGESISTVTYVPSLTGTGSESIRYVACSAQGKPLYTGKITFTTTTASDPVTPTPAPANGLTLDLSSTADGVKFSASAFESLPGATAPKLTSVVFTSASTTFGTFYYGRTASSPGTVIAPNNTTFSAVSVNPPIGSLSLDNLTFVPAAGATGVVPITFTATDASNNRYTGTVRITITSSSGTTNPSTPGTTTPSTTTPKSFSDVPKTAGSYPYITELTTSGALNGYPDGSFKPGNPVTLAEVIKLIMSVANPTEYGNLAPTSSTAHWASGYLARAIADGLVSSTTSDKELDRAANRYTIAEIATKAMKLAPVENALTSPFADMELTNTSAKYVMALYNAKIVTGSLDSKTGQIVYYGTRAITREDFATIVWKLQSYAQNGYVGVPSIG